MIFLIEYDRRKGRTLSMREFEDVDRSKAQESRLQRELDLNRRGLDHEVVLLDAATKEALRITHRRYFQNATQMLAVGEKKK